MWLLYWTRSDIRICLAPGTLFLPGLFLSSSTNPTTFSIPTDIIRKENNQDHDSLRMPYLLLSAGVSPTLTWMLSWPIECERCGLLFKGGGNRKTKNSFWGIQLPKYDAHFGFAVSECGFDRTPFRHTQLWVAVIIMSLSLIRELLGLLDRCYFAWSNYAVLLVQDLNAWLPA